MAEAYIAMAARSAGGRRKGALLGTHPADLGGAVLDGLVERAGVDPSAIEDVIVGCVTNGGEQTFAFGRNVVLASKRVPQSVPAVTIDRQCGSSQQALQFAAQAVMSGTQDMVVAMGVEHMTRVPMGSNVRLYAEAGVGTGPLSEAMKKRFGVQEFSQFVGAQMIADKYGFTREQMDAFALESHHKAGAAIKAGAFKGEIVPIATEAGLFDTDEGVRYDTSMEALGTLKPLTEGGSITAGNASQMTDGSAALLVVNEKALKAHNLTPLARVHTFAVTAGDPVIMLEEPAPATRKVLEKSGLKLDDIDLFEVNEAFAAVVLSWLKNTGADPAKLNVNGGAIALGHPLGATGAKLMTQLVHGLRNRKKRYGLQVMCEGGGVANATIIEAL
jgi:acetyl-CoA C-acetyltransferase